MPMNFALRTDSPKNAGARAWAAASADSQIAGVRMSPARSDQSAGPAALRSEAIFANTFESAPGMLDFLSGSGEDFASLLLRRYAAAQNPFGRFLLQWHVEQQRLHAEWIAH